LYAYDNKKIHPFILTGKAVVLFPVNSDYDKEFTEYFDKTEPFGYDTGQKDIFGNPIYDYNKVKQSTLGTIEEDEPPWQTVNHFYNPLFPDRGFTLDLVVGFWTGEPAIKYGIPIWQEAIEKYGYGDKNGAYNSLGRAIHLLEDMATVPHVYQDDHAYEWAQDLLKLGGNDEAWVRDNHPLITYDDYGIRQPATLSYEKFLDEMARETYFGARIQGHLYEMEVLPATGYLAKLFPPMPSGYGGVLSYMEYVDLGQLGLIKYWQISNVGYYKCPDMLKDDWWELTYEGSPGYFYIANSYNAIPVNYWDKGRGVWLPNLTTRYNFCQLLAGAPGNARLTPDQEEKIIPACISYAAGLMKYFYDIVNEPPYVKEVRIKQEGTEIYGVYWKDEFDSSGKLIGRTLRPLFGEEINPKIAKAGEIVIAVTFSEPVYELSASDIKVGGRNLDRNPTLIDGNITWQGKFTIPKDGSIDGQQEITIFARDRNEHLTTRNYTGDELDSNPSTIAKARSSGNYDWTGYEPGRDSNYRFHIITQPIVIQHSALHGVPANLDLNMTAGVLQTQGDSLSSVSLWYRNVSDGFWYTELEMVPGEENRFSAVISGKNIRADQGLEYYIFVEDNQRNTCSWPEGIVDPFSYWGPAQKVTVHTASNGGIIVQGDEDRSNDSVDISFYLVQNTDVDLELHQATDNWLYLEGSDSPDNAYDTIDWNFVTGGRGPGQYTVTWPRGWEWEGNYFYILRDVNSKEKIAQGRLAVVWPWLTVEAYSTQKGEYDEVRVEASGYAEGLFSASAFQDNSLYRAYNQRGSGPGYTISTIPRQGKEHQYRAGVYASSWGEQVLIGMSDVKSINENNAPFISPRLVQSPQTHNHPIDVSAVVTDNGQVRQVLLIYKGVEDVGWTTVTMVKSQPDSDVYSAQIEAQHVAGTVYYYFQATDNEKNTSTNPWYEPKDHPYSFEIIIDNVPPVVTRTNPENGARDVNLDIDVRVTFSEAVRGETLNMDTIRVKDANGVKKEIASIYPAGAQLTFKLKDLMPLTTYFCEITSGVLDLSGNPLGVGSVPNPWSFVTKEVLPPAITEVSPTTPENFLATTGKVVFSCKFNKLVRDVKIIFKNTSTDDEFTITDSTPILTSRDDHYSYLCAWNGKDDRGEYLPDGQYKFRIEATDAKYGITGSSEFQPFEWKVETNGTVTYTLCFKYKRSGWYSFTPNFDQYISVKYDYWFLNNRTILKIGTTKYKIGTKMEAWFGGSGTNWYFVPANTTCGIGGGGALWEVMYKQRYIDPVDEAYTSLCYSMGSERLLQRDSTSKDFHITLKPCLEWKEPELVSEDDPQRYSPEFAYVYVYAEATDVALSDIHIISPRVGKDFDDNPEVETWLDAVASFEVPGGGVLAGVLRARNISPPISPFIFDRTPPEIDVYVSSSTFSPILNQEVDITFTVTDNLLFPLRDVSLKIYDSSDNLVKTLYEKSPDSPATRTFTWDGKGSDGYNGGEVVSDGTYTYIVQAKDGAGNPNSFSGTIIVDTTPPEICDGSLLIIPANHPHPETFTTNDDAIQMAFNLSDNLSSSVNTEMVIELTSFGPLVTRQKAYGVTTTLQSVIEEWDGKDDQGNYLPDGAYKITLIATDLAGNMSSPLTLPTFSIDRTPSVPTTLYVDYLRFTPDDGPSNQGDGFQDSVTLYHILSEEALVSVRVEDVLGRTILSLSEASDFETEGAHLWDGKVNGNFVSDGSYIFRIKTTDDVGNIAYGSRTVIKNQIPAQIVFPSKDEVPAKVSGLVSIKGIALDPGINNPANFKWYKVWYRKGKDIDFSLPENDPLYPDAGSWRPVPVPSYNQNALDPHYPNSNVSWRAVAYTTLATWDTTGLTSGSYYTLLLVTEDEEGNSSYDFVTVEVDPTIDNTSPQVSITHPSDLSEFRVVSDTSTLSIVYNLTQNSGKQVDVSLVIFKMSDDGSDYGPIVYHRDYLSRSGGGTIFWDGKDNLRRYVENGRYRIWLTALDRDGLGGSVAEVDITVKVIVTEPLKIVKFAASDSVIKVGGAVEITCELSKEALVTVRIYDASDNLFEVLVDSVVTPGEVEQSVTWTSQLEGLYTCRIDAVATDAEKTRDEASISIAVTGAGLGTGIAEITSPADGSIVQGFSNFNWVATAQGEHYPPQVFVATVQAHGYQAWMETDWSGGNYTLAKDVDTTSSPGEIRLPAYKWVQTTNTHFNAGRKEIIEVMNNNVYLARTPTYNLNKRARTEYTWRNCMGGGNMYACIDEGVPDGSVFEGDKTRHPELVIKWDKPYLVNKLLYNFDVSTHGNPDWFYARLYKGGSIVYEYSCDIPDTKKYKTGDVTKKFNPVWADKAVFKFTVKSRRNVKFWVYRLYYYEVPYYRRGNIISRVFDTGNDIPVWGNFEATVGGADSSNYIKFYTQVSADGSDWDSWVRAYPGNKISSSSKRFICWRADFYGNGVKTPVLADVTINWRPPSGYLVSLPHDCGDQPTSWGKFEVWESKPGGTAIDYYTQVSENGIDWGQETRVEQGLIQSDLKPYVRWRASLSTNDGLSTPVLKQVNLSAHWEPIRPIGAHCWYGHPYYSADLASLFPLSGGFSRISPFYSIVSENNSQVTKSITDKNGYYQLKATTEVKEDWNTASDQGLSDGRIVSINNEFNNSLNYLDFILESPSITISTGYPNVNMWVDDEVKNKYTFWRNAGDSLIDNPYVSVNTESWDIRLLYLDGAENIDLIVNKQADKPSNTNTTALDDDFTVKLSSNAAPKVFVELKGNTSTPAQGFKGYSMFYKKPDETIWKSIACASNSPVINSGTLGWWDVTGLNGDYVVKLVVLDDSGSNEITKNVIIGTKVPGAEATASPPNYVTSPYNKAYLCFHPDALEKDTIVTITPVRLEDTGVSIDLNMPHPIGAFYKLQPKDIPFRRDSAGNLLDPDSCSFSVRFTYEELQGIDPAQLTIYHVKDDGSLESLDVRVVYDENGNGVFDPEEIATVTSPITSFSYYLVIPKILTPVLDEIPSPTNQKSVTLTGQAQNASLVEVFINEASVGNFDVGDDGKFSMPVSLITGSNRITCIATRWFNDIKRTSKPSEPVEVVLDVTPPEITDVYDSPDPFTPNDDGIRDKAKIFYALSEESIVKLKIYKEESLVRILVDSSKIESGPHSEVWDGKDDEGSMVEEGIYTYKIDATDLAGNNAPQEEGQLEVSYQTMPPPAPVLIAPPDTDYIDSTTPTFQLCPDESVERQLSYSIEISTDDFKTVFRKYNQTVSTQGWTLEGEIVQYTVNQEDALGDAIYKWRAFSYDDVQWSEPSVVWTFKLDMEPPPKPKLLSPEDGASVNSPRPTFDWEDVVDTVSGLDCYEIQIDNNQNFSPPKYIAIVTVSQFIPESDLAQGEYYWRVRARDKLDHYSDWTDSWRFTRTNSPAEVPTLMSPENEKFIMTKLPAFQLFSTDPDNDPLKCKIEISTDNFNTIERYYDQNISTTGWKVVEVPSSPQGIIAQYTIQPGDELAEGIYFWRASAYDGAIWSDNSPVWNFTLDMSSPTISVASPKKGEVYNARQRMIEIEFTVADLDPNPNINAYLQHTDNVRIGVSPGERIEPLDIDDGLWNLIVESKDWAGNVSSMVAGPFEVTHDIRPPRTGIVVGEPKYGQEPVYITSDTQFALAPVDDYFAIGDGKGLGLSLTEYSIDIDEWTTYTETFTVTLPGGPHTIYYRSIDKVGLREETKSLDIVIDNRVPQIILIIEGNLSTNGIDNFASLSCEYRLAVRGDSSWVDYTQFKVDSSDWKTYTVPFSLNTTGEHMIKYRIVSKTGNPEKENVFKIFVDDTPPQTTLSSSPPLFRDIYASTATVYSITGIDTLVDGKASGIAEIKYRIDGQEFKTYLENFVLTGGEHTIHYYGRDNVNNVEEENSFDVIVDTIPPHTMLIPSESYRDGEDIFAPISCTYSLESSQNLSGVNRIEFSIDNGNWKVYESPFSFYTEGEHKIKYKAVNNTGVWEEEEQFRVIVDAKGPKVESIYPENGAYVREPDIKAIEICFAEPVKIADKQWSKAVIISKVGNGTLILDNFAYDQTKYILTFTGTFEDHTTYNIELTSEIKDRVGNPLKEFSSSFTTLMLKEKGGKVEEGEVSLEIPPNALPQDAVIIISKEEDEIVNKIPRPLQSLEKDKLYHIVAYNQDHQEIQQKLNKPMEMKISYGKGSKSQTKDTSKVEGNSVNPKTLKLYWYNLQKGRWELVENSKNNFSVKEVIAQVERFGRYCLMGFIPFGDSLEGLTNYPNPFPAFGKDYTTIRYNLKDDADVAIAIYDLMGNLVRTFEIRKGGEGGTAGLNDVEWDGRNGRGDMVANGGYICRVQIDDGKRVKFKIRKILVIK